MSDQKIFGATASVRILFDGNLNILAEKLSVAFNISGFSVEPSEYSPYNEIGSAEALGWELWLQACESNAGSFELRLATEHSDEELFYGQMHDLSPWLARFLSTMCELDVTPAKTK